jgi:hypothetical protein
VIGYVTSCCVVEKTQVGMACIDREHAEEKAEIGLLLLPRKEGAAEKARAELKIGDKVSPQVRAVVLARFHFFGGK